MKKNEIANILTNWYDENGRKNLPWQVADTYCVWISEIMLQQTQVGSVIGYFKNFMKSFPTLESLAQAQEADVLSHWSGLGYYNRARNIHKTAVICIEQHKGRLPQDLDALISLPGIGRTTAGAILSLSLDLPYPILDGNVKRVMTRLFAIRADKLSQLMTELWKKVESLMPKENARKYNQSLMDLGSMVCKRSKPLCEQCPLNIDCKAFKLNKIDQYPQKFQKTKQTEVSMYALLLQNKERVFIQQRPADGIWPMLWFVPTFENKKELLKTFDKIQGEKITNFSFVHILTHRKIIILVSVINCSAKVPLIGKWCHINEVKRLPHPSALKKIVKID